MNKKIATISILAIVTLLLVGLSGCMSNTANVTSEYKVYTMARTTMSDEWKNIGNGFVKDEYGFGLIRNVIIVSFENLEDHPIDVKVTIDIYDENGNFLDKEIGYAHDVQAGASHDTKLYYYHQGGNHFYDVSEIDVTVENC